MRLILTLVLITIAVGFGHSPDSRSADTSPPARAKWLDLHETGVGHTYIEPTTVREDPSSKYRRVWMLMDLQKPQDGGHSIKALQEFDCRNERTRVLFLILHSEPMGVGSALRSTRPEGEEANWIPIPPDSSVKIASKLVCSFPSVPIQER